MHRPQRPTWRPPMRSLRVAILFTLALLAATTAFAQQDPASAYRIPPREIVEILDAEPLPAVVLSPMRDVMVLLSRRSMPSIAELAKPMLALAGSRVDPATNGPHTPPSGTGITLREVASGVERHVRVPADARIALLGFSPDGRRFAFTHTTESRVELHLVDVAT